MTWDELVFRPLEADIFIYQGTGDLDPAEEPGGGEALRPEVEMRGRSTDRGSNEIVDPFDPGSGGSGGQGGQAPCWENITEKCFKVSRGKTMIRRAVPIGDFKLGTAALNWNQGFANQFNCGDGPDTIGDSNHFYPIEDQERIRIQYYEKLRNMGFSEVTIPLPQWKCGDEFIVREFTRDIELALEGGFSCRDIQVEIPGQVFVCLLDGTLTRDNFEAILADVNRICPEGIRGIWIDEPINHPNANAFLPYMNSVTTEYGIPLLLSGYYTAITPFGNAGTLDDRLKEYATGGVSCSGYHKVFEFNTAEIVGPLVGSIFVSPLAALAILGIKGLEWINPTDVPFNAWDELWREFASRISDDFIVFPWANPVFNHINEYLQKAKRFKRLYWFPGDIFYGNENRNTNIFDETDACCVTSHFEALGCDQNDPIDSGPNGGCDDLRAYIKCEVEGKSCAQSEHDAATRFRTYFDAVQPIENAVFCSHNDFHNVTCFNSFRKVYCEEYWREMQNFVDAAVKEGWLRYEYEETYTGVTDTLYCKYRNCDDCNQDNPEDWIDHPLPPCKGEFKTQPDENQWWSDPIIG